MIFYSTMVNSWSLLYDELYGEDGMAISDLDALDRVISEEPLQQHMEKYSEKKILEEIGSYITNTYRGHYSVGNVQTLDLIDSVGDAEAFCRSNVLKYASRYDRKGTARADILKIIHYGILLLHFNDKAARHHSNQTSTTAFSVDYDK